MMDWYWIRDYIVLLSYANHQSKWGRQIALRCNASNWDDRCIIRSSKANILTLQCNASFFALSDNVFPIRCYTLQN